MKRRIVLSAVFVVLASAIVLAADYVILGGFIGIVKEDISDGVTRTSPIKIWGTDNREIYVVATLTAVGPDGKTLCTAVNEFTRPLADPVQPLAFRLTYQRPATTPKVPIRVQTATYRLIAKWTWREMPPSNKMGTRTTEYPAEFPTGGTPGCMKLPL